jgi:hypothetical protein
VPRNGPSAGARTQPLERSKHHVFNELPRLSRSGTQEGRDLLLPVAATSGCLLLLSCALLRDTGYSLHPGASERVFRRRERLAV